MKGRAAGGRARQGRKWIPGHALPLLLCLAMGVRCPRQLYAETFPDEGRVCTVKTAVMEDDMIGNRKKGECLWKNQKEKTFTVS